MKLIDNILSGLLSGAIGGVSGGYFFAISAASWVRFQDAGPSATLPALFGGLAFGLFCGSFLGLIIGASVLVVGANHRWPLIGGLIGAVMGPLPLFVILGISAPALNSASMLGFVMAALTGGLGGAFGGYIFNYRL